MSIRGSNFENQHPFASDHALVWERCMPDGILYGVDLSFTSALFTIGTGFMLVTGRMFEITAAENISISPGSGYARVYVAINTGGTATKNSFDQVSFGVDYAATLDDFTELTQDEININQGAAVYQAEVAVLAIDSGGATAIERQMEFVSPGAGAGAFAAIAVTYPAGSTVTVTDGKITYTAPNTSGAALFIIPYAATWTVTATDGTETASQTVEITSEGQSVSVELSYREWLYKDGNEYTAKTGGWVSGGTTSNASSYNTAGTTQNTDGQLRITLPNYGNSNSFITAEPINLDGIDTIYFYIDAIGSGRANITMGATKSRQYLSVNAVSKAEIESTDLSVGWHALDVSGLSGEYYIGFGARVGAQITSDAYIYVSKIYID